MLVGATWLGLVGVLLLLLLLLPLETTMEGEGAGEISLDGVFSKLLFFRESLLPAMALAVGTGGLLFDRSTEGDGVGDDNILPDLSRVSISGWYGLNRSLITLRGSLPKREEIKGC